MRYFYVTYEDPGVWSTFPLQRLVMAATPEGALRTFECWYPGLRHTEKVEPCPSPFEINGRYARTFSLYTKNPGNK